MSGEIFGREPLERAVDREDAARATRLVVASSSNTPRRCAACGHWQRADATTCRGCRVPFSPQALRGLDRVA